MVRFQPLEPGEIEKLLVDQKIATDQTEARRLAVFSGGSLTRAAELADPHLWTFRSSLLAQLSHWPLPSVMIAQTVAKFVDEAGKEAPARRARLRLVIGFAADFFRRLVLQLAGTSVEADAEMNTATDRAVKQSHWDLETSAEAADRCLEAWLKSIEMRIKAH